MKTNRTELVFILDRSGSMAGLESDTIGGYNAMLKKQQAQAGEVRVTTVLFDDRIELLHDRLELAAVAPLTDKEYYARGCTALLDAIGSTIGKIANVQRSVSEEYRADKVLFVITTDGYENASREFDADQVKRMVKERQEKDGWEFIFLGANIDAVSTAGRFGICADHAVNYCPDAAGTALNFDVVSETVSHVRTGARVNRNWKKRIEADYKKRG